MEQKLPVIIHDCDESQLIYCIVMMPEYYDKSVITDIISDIKDKYPGEWSIEDILSEIMENYPNFDIYNCQDISTISI